MRTTIALTLAALAAGCSASTDEAIDLTSADALTGTGPRGITPAAGSSFDCELLVVGAGTGGFSAALAATELGAHVCLTEETDWVGGQLTAQGLNASDDSRYTDTIGSTKSYQHLRAAMRNAYGRHSNPGGCWVSYLCAEPKVALDVLAAMAKPAVDSGALSIYYNVKAASVKVADGRVASVTFARTQDGGSVTMRAKQTIDATELGDVIKLSGAAYRAGQEARSDTNEADAPTAECKDCIQSFTYDVVLEKRPSNERHVIPKPEGYGVLPWMKGFSHQNFKMFGSGSVWNYRRIVDGAAFGKNDLSIMNWGAGGNDYPFGSIVDKSPEEVKIQLERGRQRALAYVYWLQTEVDGHGYPYLMMRSDVLGTTTGVAKYPYIREGRRLRALETIRAEDVSDFYVHAARSREWSSSVGVGFYPLDMHENVAEGTGYARGHSLPFQIPMGALIPETMNGLLAGAKDIGTTHLTNSAYRLHPIEWAVGEAAGTLAAMSLSWGIEPRDAFANEGHSRELQDRLIANGAPLYWIDDVATDSPAWRDVQLVATAGIMGGPEVGTLHFRPELVINRAQAAAALVRAMGIEPIVAAHATFSDVPLSHWASGAIEALAAKGVVTGTGGGQFSPQADVTAGQMRIMISRVLGDAAAQNAVPESSRDGVGMTRLLAAGALARGYRARIHLPVIE